MSDIVTGGVWNELRQVFEDGVEADDLQLNDDDDIQGGTIVPIFSTQVNTAPGREEASGSWRAPKTASKQQRKILRHRRLARVAALYLAGRTQESIAEELGVNPLTIHRDVAELQTTWREQSLARVEHAAVRNFQRLDLLFEKALQFITINGDAQAMNAAVKIIQEQNAMLGIKQGITIDVESYVRAMAESQGYDPDKAIEIASRIAVTFR